MNDWGACGDPAAEFERNLIRNRVWSEYTQGNLSAMEGKQIVVFLNQLLARIPGEVEVLWDNECRVTASQAAWDS